ncbi:MAG: hypothetical protein Tsb0016_22770 [Sphingomonadales bacterium]
MRICARAAAAARSWRRLAGGGLAALALLTQAPAPAAAAGSLVPGRGDDTTAVHAVVHRSLMSWETLDEADFVDTAHPQMIFAYPGQRTDFAGALEVFRMWRDKFRDTRVYVHQILVDGSRFAAEYQFATTNKASGLRTVMGTVAIGEVCDGRIILLKEYTDSRVDDLQREGKLPLDEGAEPYPSPWVAPQ